MLTRRELLSGAGALATLALTGHTLAGCARARARFSDHPFTLGVASGDPRPDGVVLWTRLAPEPLKPAAACRPEPVPVGWEVAADERMRARRAEGQRHGRAGAGALGPRGGCRASSPAAGTGTASARAARRARSAGPAPRPAATRRPERLRFAFASCQHWEQGYFTAYRHMLRRRPRPRRPPRRLHLRDLAGAAATCASHERAGAARRSTDYRHRHALYKTDPDLQAAHAAYPWVVTWDDHEVAEQLRRATARRTATIPRGFLAPARRRLPGVLRAHAAAARHRCPTGRTCGSTARSASATLAPTSRARRPPVPRRTRPAAKGGRGGGQLVERTARRAWIPPRRCSAPRRSDGCSKRPRPRRGRGWNVLAQQQLMAQLASATGPARTAVLDRRLGRLSRTRAQRVLSTARATGGWRTPS